MVPLLPVPPGVPGLFVPLPELPVPLVPLVCAKTNVAVMQSRAKVRMSIFVDVRYIIVSFNSSLVMGMVPRRVASPALQVPNATAGAQPYSAICMPQRQGAAIERTRARTPKSRTMGGDAIRG